MGAFSASSYLVLQNNKAKPYQRRFRTFLLAWFGMIVSSLHAVFIHFANKNKLKKSMQLSKNMIKNYFTIFCKKMSIFVRNSSNFLHTIFIPQATIGTKNPGNSTTNTAKITPFFYKEEKNCEISLYELIHRKMDCRECSCGLSSHQSNWNVKSRAQAAAEKYQFKS